MLHLSAEPLDPHALREQCRDTTAGGFVCFEGWVRKHNEGRDVTQLEFEAADALAHKEFAKIETEIRAQFEVVDVLCAHRTGMVALGGIAVWIGITAHHRDAAFKACRYTIDELKERLPIWKKETYTDGDSGWINHP